MYNIVKIVEKDGRRIGFVLREINVEKNIYFSEEDTRILCSKNQVLNVRYTGKQFRKRQGRMSDFPVVQYNRIYPKSAKKIKGYIEKEEYSCRTGDALQRYINITLKGISKERDFVKHMMRYCRDDRVSRGKVYAISGLRSTGKSIGMCQCIRRLKNYDKTVYIQFVRGKDIEFNVLSNILIDLPDNIKYIFIDEISAVKNFVHCSGILADNYTLDGKKVVIAGTDSYAIECAFGDGLFHRCIVKNITFISYKEYVRTIGGSLKDYLTSGGLYEASSYQGVQGLKSYINTSVVGNITSTILKNKLSDFYGVSEQDIRTATYIVLYAIIYSNANKLSFDRIINATVSNKVSSDEKDYFRMFIDQSLDTKQGKQIDICVIKKVLQALEYMHVVTTCTNISVYCEKKYTNYYIVSPYLVNNLYSMLVDFILSLGGRVRQRNFSPVNGMVLESILITHAINYSGYECYFYHNMKNHSEVDLVLLSSDMSKVEVDTYLVEIKLSDKPEVAYAKGHWVREISGGDFMENNIEIVSRKILYMGKTDKEHGLVNCKEFLDNIENLSSILL